MVKVLLFGLALGACGYGAHFSDCTVTCSSESGCPGGFECVAGICRSTGATSACGQTDDASLDGDVDGPVGSDAEVIDAAMIDAPRTITLSETSPDVATVPGPICVSGFRHLYRVFRLADFGITGPFTVTGVGLWVWQAQAVSTTTLRVGTYSGMLNSTAYQHSDFTVLGSSDVAIPDEATGGELVSEPFPATIVPAGSQVAVEVLVPAGGTFEIGSIGNGAATVSGYVSSGCANNDSLPPSTTSGFIVTLTGTY
jgi:hypothetical protein